VRSILPKAKLIMLTRHPSERFYSHYLMFERLTKEGKKGFALPPLLSFIEREIQAYQNQQPTKLIHQGLYTHYLNQWERCFGKDQLRVIATSRLSEPESAAVVMKELCTYLGLEPYDFGHHLQVKHNRAKSSAMPSEAKAQLDAFYQDSMQALAQQYDIHFS
ncbi:MAG: hypothetical protein AAGD05_19245, partial [Bacteroidota bacterium]